MGHPTLDRRSFGTNQEQSLRTTDLPAAGLRGPASVTDGATRSGRERTVQCGRLPRARYAIGATGWTMQPSSHSGLGPRIWRASRRARSTSAVAVRAVSTAAKAMIRRCWVGPLRRQPAGPAWGGRGDSVAQADRRRRIGEQVGGTVEGCVDAALDPAASVSGLARGQLQPSTTAPERHSGWQALSHRQAFAYRYDNSQQREHYVQQ
jgi:hypothetical protein